MNDKQWRFWIDTVMPGGQHPPTAKVYLYDDIGRTPHADGVHAKSMLAALQPHEGKRIELHLHSAGGSIFDAFVLYEYLLTQPDVVTYVDGDASSSASVLALAGSMRYIDRNAHMAVHDAWVSLGREPRNREERAYLREQEQLAAAATLRMADIYRERAGQTDEWWRAQMKGQGRTFDAGDAVRAGLAHQVTGGVGEPTTLAMHRQFVAGVR